MFLSNSNIYMMQGFKGAQVEFQHKFGRCHPWIHKQRKLSSCDIHAICPSCRRMHAKMPTYGRMHAKMPTYGRMHAKMPTECY